MIDARLFAKMDFTLITINKYYKMEKQTRQIDRDSYEPVYVQLANILSTQIATGELETGERIPSESGLCKLYKVSPMTVRRAINLLVDKGVVVTERGRGTYVKQLNLSSAVFKFADFRQFYDDPSAIEVKILEVSLTPADAIIAEKLALPEGERAIHLRRLLKVYGEPFIYHYEYLVCDVNKPIVEAELEVTSMQGFFEGCGNDLFKRGELNVRAELVSIEEANLLKLDRPAAAINLTHIFYDHSDRPLSWGCFVCPSDRLTFNSFVGMNITGPSIPRIC